MDLSKALQISATGMKAQGTRVRVIAENMANADTTPVSPNDQPYRRKVVSFQSVLDRTTGARGVAVSRIGVDKSDFQKKYEPGHPAADKDGYVQKPNVNSLIEVMDMREAQRSYEANLGVIELSKSMLMKTIDLLRG